ncbi:hypothetical protein [Glycomyces buryatensis]|uniref:ARB-07466-like C-terminal domain-containing protein n=1 Tax=Glycomyces buryatensis TaxID=2570927 RepID=A0A4S8PSZ0_9ACTN|nr:hypothetical protein [Glycomyces buryatensis]THV33421.1 hypothetical protein FAB82_25065 [Glycomyces buryatensis]
MRANILPIACIAALLVLLPAPAAAEPDEETLESDLADAISAVADAEDEVDATEARGDELAAQIEDTEAELAALQTELNEYAIYLYTEGELQTTAATLAADNPDEMVAALTFTGYLADQRAAVVADAGELLAQLEAEQDAHADEVQAAEAALEEAEEAADDLEEKLEELQAENAAGPGSDGGAPAADPVPRNSDGSLPSESCSEDDPTTSGCLTPRTLHVYNETKEAGFDRYVSCYRGSGGGEHPLGRACDFAAASGGFEDVDAGGDDKAYGDQLAAWYVNNADALGIEYVIWYREFWSPSSGWKSYSGANGTPAADHTNHVHVSVR